MEKNFKYIILNKISLYINKLILEIEKNNSKSQANNFDALTPIDSATDKEIYFIAIKEALLNDDIKNIALTGTYGSGKSSIIKTFQKKHQEYNYLNISLASFKDNIETKNDNDEENLNRLIELSILQQIFYKEKHSDIPDSRFKRIKNINKKEVLLNSFFFLIWSLSITYLFKHDVVDNEFSEVTKLLESNYIKNISLVISLLGFYYLSIKLVRIFNNSKLNKLNIQSADIEIGDNNDKSILNHHLDEILYFFEVTKYDIVVIEDLDRFNDTEIFTKLRELNNLINGSKQIRRKIVFLYAIRDNMFQDKDRTKFFDFIVPVIPIINPSNSNEIIKRKLSKLNSKNIPTEDFIDDVSIFIEDMRLLINICNEYSLYKENLGKNLNQNNLFAMIIYKNLCPDDFAELHNGKGLIYNLITDKPNYVKNRIENIDKSILEYRKEIKNIENEKNNDINELRAIYIQELTIQKPEALSIKLNNIEYSFGKLIEDNLFNLLKSQSKLSYYYLSHYSGTLHHKYENTINFSFNEIENEVNDEFTYDEREQFIIDNEENKINKLKQEIEKLNNEKNEIRSWNLKKVLNTIGVSTVFTTTDIKNKKLISYLLVNGFIDENYYDYISYFHEGSITKQDWEFLQNVKSQMSTEFDFKLNKPNNLIKKISDKEFERESILNFNLLDYLLKNRLSYSDKINSIFKLLSNWNGTTFDFIKGYIDNGEYQPEFIRLICHKWIGFWKYIEEESLFTDEKKDEYLKLILRHSHIEDIKLQSEHSKLVEYINSKADFFSFINNEHALEEIKEIISILNVKLTTIENPDVNKELFEIIYYSNSYSINSKNIAIILKYFEQDISEIETANYTTIQLSVCDELKDYVEEKIDFYVSEVIMKLPENKLENETYFVNLLNNQNIASKNIIGLVNKIETLISDITSVKVAGVKETLLRAFKVKPIWNNLYKYFQDNDKKINDALIKFLNYKSNYDELSKTAISNSKEEDYPIFREQILLCNEISDESYSSIVKSISFKRDKLSFEQLSTSKIKSLINNVLNVTVDNYDLLREHFANQHIDLLYKRPETYITDFEKYEIDNNDLLLILNSNQFSIKQKIEIVLKVDKNLIFEEVETSDKVCEILSGVSKLEIDYEFIKNLLSKSKNIGNRLKIFNIYFKDFSKLNIDELLNLLPIPYSTITKKGKRPEIGKSITEIEFAKNLKTIGYISSIKETERNLKINTKLK
ncbi:hypothetical protein AX766_08710 [Flavobacterium covae]|uniref:YobI family P-loop NTPase n=1 Tax=Flavobacterium covae TaxID=2906076 RepID=UPI0007C1D137|nr:hypothetical protein [Flavobacterium covae]AND64486.1 hypothetical protein AX766_08710 [Flavobacterium covae]